jgi:hypothetical protein
MTSKLNIILNEFKQSIKLDDKVISMREEKLINELINRFGESNAIDLSETILRNSLQLLII